MKTTKTQKRWNASLGATLGATLGLLAAAPLALAAPDAGQLLNEQQRLNKPGQQPVNKPALLDAEAAQAAQSGGFKAQIKQVRFTGAEGLASETELQAWVADRLGRSLNHAELQALAARVTAQLQARGYMLARAYLPPQDLSEGVLEVAVLVGRLESGAGRVQLLGKDGGLNTRLNTRLAAIANAALPPGAVRGEQIERAILLINDVPGVSARASLDKGAEPGSSRIIVTAEELPALGGSVFADNFSNRYTGALRVGAQGFWNRPLGLEDVAGLSLSASEGTKQAALSYAFALNPAGLRANLAASYLRYEVGQELKRLDLSGSAQSLVAGLSYPLLRGREQNLWLSLDAERKQLSDQALGLSLRERRLHRLGAGLSGSGWDTLLGGGLNEFSAGLSVGQLNLAGNAGDQAADALSARTQGGFHKLSWRLARSQSVAADWAPNGLSLYLAANGQQASRNLDSSEKFMLGGPNGVRSYAVGEAVGDSGWVFNGELRQDFMLGGGLRAQALGFVDSGSVTQHASPWAGALQGQPNRYTLHGVGLGLNLFAQSWSVRSGVARALGENEGRNPATGLEADGRQDRYRLWLQLQARF
ncbi:hemolysin activation/secretion protein [Paucibacter oligotrophus]|uniref:Hemolysin activation/secretion protein n=1 Tax=Roseateles oligotrophus TaxID=1769250 RepID=A0A840LH07_9BURK|nr:ShlB/FhaC/HecB family hemolysin secretion/activation protein [Roseateles oligotrophus]MBB4844557.1 hemolysin activation/secretion protein [Roseateles oligotrophus]